MYLSPSVIALGFFAIAVAVAVALFFPSNTPSGVAIVAMMKDPKNIETWLARHRKAGIIKFYIKLEDTPDLEAYLKSQEDVTVTTGSSVGVNEYDNQQVRQDAWVDDALKMAGTDPRLGWLVHIDADEIVVGDLNKLAQLPSSVRTVWFQNVEAKFPDVPGKTDSCFNAAEFVNCAEAPCAAYGNGKSAGRVAPDVSAHGPHRMKSSWYAASGDTKVDDILVEHYESCDFDTYKKKFKRLAVQDRPSSIPFSYYNESIAAAKSGDEQALDAVYRKYRVVK